MLFFVKNNTVHRYPLPGRCPARYNEEQLRDTIPHGTEECIYCMHRWPEDQSDVGVG
ncbi:hypothetical protein [Geotalea sp. SG265]|uniref:hypothetical protein n=1 Tax=Geotalea sp. SG265 TaxID=2922867 RepID=UPI001FAFEE7A|nr:hypothetical protein [Geotalea sp. SG265]